MGGGRGGERGGRGGERGGRGGERGGVSTGLFPKQAVINVGW